MTLRRRILNFLLAEVMEELRKINDQLKEIMSKTYPQIIEQLKQAKADQDEANAEINAKFTDLNAAIKALQDKIENAEAGEELEAAVDAVSAGAKALADVIPNPPTGGSGDGGQQP